MAQEAIGSSKPWKTCLIHKSAKSTEQNIHQPLQQEFRSQVQSCELDTEVFAGDDVSHDAVGSHVANGHLKSKPDFRAHWERISCCQLLILTTPAWIWT